MPKHLTVEYRIPVRGQHPSRGAVIEFLSWLPQGEEHGIAVQREGISLFIYFDETCVGYPRERDADAIKRQRNVGMYDILIRASTTVENQELVNYIEGIDPAVAPGESQLGDEYKRLGETLTHYIIEVLNRLVAFLRTEKRHYWLSSYFEMQPGNIPKAYEGWARFDDGACFRWRPSNVQSFAVVAPSEDDCISEGDWAAARKAVANERFRPWPAGALLADAFLLRDKGYGRAALVEACAALEVAIDRFLEAPLTAELFNPERAIAVNIQGLLGKAREIGMRGNVNLLLPMILPAEVVSNRVMSDVQDAVGLRNEIVHRGKRKLDGADLNRYLRAIEELCKTLRRLTETRKTKPRAIIAPR